MDTPVQMTLAFDHDYVVIEQKRKSRSSPSKGKQAHQVHDPAAPVQIEIDLAFPLFDVDDFLVSGLAEEIRSRTSYRPPRRQITSTSDLTAEMASLWLAKMFYRNLELLLWSKEGDAGTRAEILKWVFATGWTWGVSPDWTGWLEPEEGEPRRNKQSFVGPPVEELVWTTDPLPEGKESKLHLVPFSFECCCLVENIDPEYIKQCIQERLSELSSSKGRSRIRAALH